MLQIVTITENKILAKGTLYDFKYDIREAAKHNRPYVTVKTVEHVWAEGPISLKPVEKEKVIMIHAIESFEELED